MTQPQRIQRELAAYIELIFEDRPLVYVKVSWQDKTGASGVFESGKRLTAAQKEEQKDA